MPRRNRWGGGQRGDAAASWNTVSHQKTAAAQSRGGGGRRLCCAICFATQWGSTCAGCGWNWYTKPSAAGASRPAAAPSEAAAVVGQATEVVGTRPGRRAAGPTARRWDNARNPALAAARAEVEALKAQLAAGGSEPRAGSDTASTADTPAPPSQAAPANIGEIVRFERDAVRLFGADSSEATSAQQALSAARARRDEARSPEAADKLLRKRIADKEAVIARAQARMQGIQAEVTALGTRAAEEVELMATTEASLAQLRASLRPEAAPCCEPLVDPELESDPQVQAAVRNLHAVRVASALRRREAQGGTAKRFRVGSEGGDGASLSSMDADARFHEIDEEENRRSMWEDAAADEAAAAAAAAKEEAAAIAKAAKAVGGEEPAGKGTGKGGEARGQAAPY